MQIPHSSEWFFSIITTASDLNNPPDLFEALAKQNWKKQHSHQWALCK